MTFVSPASRPFASNDDVEINVKKLKKKKRKPRKPKKEYKFTPGITVTEVDVSELSTMESAPIPPVNDKEELSDVEMVAPKPNRPLKKAGHTETTKGRVLSPIVEVPDYKSESPPNIRIPRTNITHTVTSSNGPIVPTIQVTGEGEQGVQDVAELRDAHILHNVSSRSWFPKELTQEGEPTTAHEVFEGLSIFIFSILFLNLLVCNLLL